MGSVKICSAPHCHDVEKRSKAQRNRDRVRRRWLFRGMSCAAGPPGLANGSSIRERDLRTSNEQRVQISAVDSTESSLLVSSTQTQNDCCSAGDSIPKPRVDLVALDNVMSDDQQSEDDIQAILSFGQALQLQHVARAEATLKQLCIHFETAGQTRQASNCNRPDEHNFKVLYRRALAHFHRSEIEEALTDLSDFFNCCNNDTEYLDAIQLMSRICEALPADYFE